ncbi:DUF2339 domain-containing protein [Siphonobacter sp. SORGH_AS_1065]|uniref:DUF2339 domain-containing protein n=1 Tax=Siphonobacter sp. SORGH_AS_1065 TaxID=3041795 RepID=UPI00278AF202|nr:DUF2339 domain-containing protein [Siphonobacter sp. SORGH_AS_1065]MDQ1088684.1 putative membrane protein [Siphonobacter sp. SORGH_AS_1065]
MNERNRIDALEAEVQRLAEQLSSAQKNLIQIQRELSSLRPDTTPVKTVTQTPIAPPSAPVSAVSPPVITKPAPTYAKTPTEEYIGGNLLSKVGIAALVIGIAIFVKYAFDNDLIGPWGRLALGWSIGSALVTLALWLKPKYLTYSAVLLSGGVATVYLTTYAAYYFYQFLPSPLSFALMVLVTLFTVWQATRYEVQWIGLFGLVGAYAVPFLVGGNGSPWGLFVYMTILNAGVLSLAYQRDWQLMNTSAFFVTWLIFIAFIINGFDRPGYVWISLVFGTIFFLLMYANQLVYPLFQKAYAHHRTILQIVLNALFFYIPTYFILKEQHYSTLSITAYTFTNSLFHGGIAWFLRQRNLTSLADASLSMALVFLILMVPIQLEGDWITLVWAGGAATLYTLGIQRSSKILTHFGTALINLTACALLIHGYSIPNPSLDYLPYWNLTFFTNALFLAAVIFMLIQSIKAQQVGFSRKLLGLLLFVMGYYVISMEWDRYFAAQGNLRFPQSIRNLVFSIYTSLYIGATLVIIAPRRLYFWQVASLVLSVLIFIYIFFQNPVQAVTLLTIKTPTAWINARYLLYLGIAGITYGLYRMIPDDSNNWKQTRNLFLYAIHGVILWVLSQELVTLFILNSPAEAAEQRLMATQAGFSVLWGVYSLTLIVLGFSKKIKRYRLAGIALFGVVLIKLLIFDLSRVATGGKIIIFLSVGVLLLVTSFLYQKFKDKLL